jgi:hypothetical protein
MYACLECGRKFKTTKAAERAADKGCPGCRGADIDLEVTPGPNAYERRREARRDTTFQPRAAGGIPDYVPPRGC